MGHSTIPDPRPVAWELKSLSSAKTALDLLGDGRMEMMIEHQELAGVTPEMLAWWYASVDGPMEYMGRVWQRYLVWHRCQ